MKVLFVMFQGGGTPESAWQMNDDGTKIPFFEHLRKLGEVYTYQNKLYNIAHYDPREIIPQQFDVDLQFDVSYFDMKHHVKQVYNAIKSHKGIFIPIGWSAGGYFCMMFAKLYRKRCPFMVLIDPVRIAPTCINARIKVLKSYTTSKQKRDTLNNLSKIQRDIMQRKLINPAMIDKQIADINLLRDIGHYMWTTSAKKNLSIKLPIKTLAFRAIEDDTEETVDNKNKMKLLDDKVLKKNNPRKYSSSIYLNKPHQLYANPDVENDIIMKIKAMLFY